MRIYTLDSTLHDGTRAGRVSFGLEDKLLITRRLDEFGIDIIDCGDDAEFVARAAQLNLRHARVAAFGEVGSAMNTIEAATPVVILAGDSWDLHVYKTLGTTADAHLAAIRDTVAFFKNQGREVIYNAEHFFDAFEGNPDFAMSTLHAAGEAGADVLCLCDSNGGTLTSRLAEIAAAVRHSFHGTLGIHAHNDADLAVANTLAAVECGFAQVQGCMNGYGERCGCANLCSILPNLELKAGHMTVGRERLEGLNPLAHFISELANLALPPEQPYVGAGAFAHSAPEWMEGDHTRPEYVGNAGHTGDLMWRLSRDPLAKGLTAESRRELIDLMKQKEYEGYDLAGADGTFELLLRETLAPGTRFFTALNYEVATRKNSGFDLHTTADVSVEVGEAILSATAAGAGPVHALDVALRQCLLTVYPSIGSVRLVDYKVRILDPHKGSAARARVLTEWTDGGTTWTTAGVSENIIEASWLALAGAVELELLRLHATAPAPAEDYSWAV